MNAEVTLPDCLLITDCQDFTSTVQTLKKSGKTIGVVLTMGALHEGHLSLVRASLEQADVSIVTLFVNPTQFAPNEDFDKYPKQLNDDLEQLRNEGELIVFAPAAAQMYPDNFSTRIKPPNVAKQLEGEYRPTFFEGVSTIVLKLLNLTQADIAFFGQKDFQQQVVVRRMVEDLNVPVEICVCPIIRESDGLAMSSRNVYLSEDERQIALSINRTLSYVEDEVRAGRSDGFELSGEMRQMLIDGGVTSIDYATIVDPETLETRDRVVLPSVALIAAHVGATRLIDNRLISNDSPSKTG